MLPKLKRCIHLLVLMGLILAQGPVYPAQGTTYSLSTTSSISGRVTDGSGIGLAGVTILAVLDPLQIFLPQIVRSGSSSATTVSNPPESGQNYYTVETDADGYYNLDALPPGRYVISARKTGQDFAPITHTVVTTSGGSGYDFQETVIPTVYTPGTITLSDATLAALVAISSDGTTYTFATETGDLAVAKPGDTLIGGISTLTPEGFLRKVVSISANGDQRILVTEPATLEDAFESLSVSTTQQLTSDQVQGSLANIPGVALVQAPALMGTGDFEFALNNAVLYDHDGSLSTTGDQIVANGLLAVSPNIEFRIRMENGVVEELYYTSTMKVQTGFTVSSKISLSVPLVEKNLVPTMTLGAIPVGPLVLTPTLDLVAGITGSVFTGVSATISNTTSFTAGLWHVDSQTRFLSSFTSNFSFGSPTYSNGISFKAFVGPKISVKIYGVVGGYVKPGLALNLTIAPASDPWLTLKGGLEVAVGLSVTVPIVNIELLNIQMVAIDHWILLYSLSHSTDNTQPDPPANPSPPHEAGNQSLTMTLGWTGRDPDGDTLVYDVYLDAGNPHPVTKVANHQLASTYSPGPLTADTTYYWKVVAFDQHGLSTRGPVWSFTTIASGVVLPGAFDLVSPANGAPSQPTSLILDWEDSSGVTGYGYCYDTTNDNACTNWTTVATLTSQIAISGLSANTTYYWLVRAMNSAGTTYANGSATVFWSFTTDEGAVIPGEMLNIPAGSFHMGCDPSHNGGYSCPSSELPLHTITLDSYRIDKYEVTNAQYAQCVTAGQCAVPDDNSSYTRTSYYTNPTYSNYPVIYVSWQDAANYCTWAGKRLPTEAEWERAARGSTVIAYPWGDASPTCSLANFGGSSTCVGDTSAVGSNPAGASPNGVMDMAGNVWEWVNDWYSSSYYSISPSSNPQGPATGTYRVLRGGSWYNLGNGLQVAHRYSSSPALHYDAVGFRCAASPIPGEMVLIPAGSFHMGCDPDHNGGYACSTDELPLHTVTLDAYRIDKYEVTNAQYAQCVTAGNCEAPYRNDSGDRSSYFDNPTYANYPVIYVSWQDATNYCAWAGKRLPTEAEWEKAARGTNVITYPWGDASPTCSLANYDPEGTNDCMGNTSAVGSYPAGASPYGVMDMAGNVTEWVNDWYSVDYYSVSPSSNPQGPASGSDRVVRGGSWTYDVFDMLVASRGHGTPTYRNYGYYGFRCAAAPED